MNLDTSTILVTGASGGIGSRVCSLLALGGSTLILNGTHAGRMNRVKATLPGNHHVVMADIKEAAGRQKAVDACESAGGIDAVVNLAGLLDFNLFHEQDVAEIELMFQVNALGPMLLIRQLLPQLLERPEARILNVGATYGSVGHPGFVAYGASKAALRAFSEALARELGDTSVSVAYIAPRTTDTQLNSERVLALHNALGNECDPPLLVAAEIINMLDSSHDELVMGFRERLLVKLNAIFPSIVTTALVKKLSLIKQHARK